MSFLPTHLKKTKMCRNLPFCQFGRKCWHAHSEEELRCPHYAKNTCVEYVSADGRCPFGKHEGRVKERRDAYSEPQALPQQHPAAPSGPRAPRSFAGVCHNCFQSGHLARNCPNPAAPRPEAAFERAAFSRGFRPAEDSPDYIKELRNYGIPGALSVYIARTKDEALSGNRELSAAIGRYLGIDKTTTYAQLGSDRHRQEVLHRLLWADEAQHLNDMRRYDMSGVQFTEMQHHRATHRMMVPGLAEKRPSVLRGDTIVAIDITGRAHHGYVHFVNLDSVDVSFNRTYVGYRQAYDVCFKLARTQWRIQHRAVDEMNSFQFDASLLSGPAPAVVPVGAESIPARLNERQRTFLLQVTRTPQRVQLLWGPPGTGKTTTFVAAVAMLARACPDASFLVATPSNAAVDHFTAKLLEQAPDLKYRMLCVNSLTRARKDIPESILPVCTPELGGGCVFPKADEIWRGRIVLATLATASKLYSIGVEKHFDFLVLDEAGQATETELLLVAPLASTKARCFIAGDHKQLGPIVPPVLMSYRLARSPLVRLLDDKGRIRDECTTMLWENYRSEPEILELFNPTYGNRLLAKSTACQAYRPYAATVCAEFGIAPGPVLFVHSNGAESREPESPSWLNIAEADVVLRVIESLLYRWNAFKDIVVLTPYLQQVKKIKAKLHWKYQNEWSGWVDATLGPRHEHIKVCTVEQFQGKEAPVVIMSCVRSREVEEVGGDISRHLGFLRQPERLNVAISRPQSLLVVVGNATLLAYDPEWRRIYTHLYERSRVCAARRDAPAPDLATATVAAAALSMVIVIAGTVDGAPNDEGVQPRLE